jgi:hypothetical protein
MKQVFGVLYYFQKITLNLKVWTVTLELTPLPSLTPTPYDDPVSPGGFMILEMNP